MPAHKNVLAFVMVVPAGFFPPRASDSPYLAVEPGVTASSTPHLEVLA
jgi:hypothetical protein